MGWVVTGKVVVALGLLVALIGTALVGFMPLRVTTRFTGGARLYGPDPSSEMEGLTEPAVPRRWRRGWVLIFVGILLQLVGLVLG
jgi:hypothetical protein